MTYIAVRQRHCWLRLKSHHWMLTGSFRISGGPFNRGTILVCSECKHRKATVNRVLIQEAARNTPR